MELKTTRKQLKIAYFLLTVFSLFVQFYALTLKLPFSPAYSTKLAGFFALFSDKLAHHFALWIPLITFFIAHIILQSCVCILLYFTNKQLAELFPLVRRNFLLSGVLLWETFQAGLFLWNWYLFPYSFFSYLIEQLHFEHVVYITLLVVVSLVISILVLIAIFNLVRTKKILAITAIAIFLLAYYSSHMLPKSHFAMTKQPNIIIIIADSLRPDYAKPAKPTSQGPVNLQQFSNQSAFFANSYAVLGRSTPGLITVLTGTYPKTNGARFNLIPNHYLHLDNSLITILKKEGYQTIFLGDGRQFLNLSNAFNFDQIITPQAGIYDHLFSIVNDTPLSNLLVNTTLGKILFPYNYANRASYHTYLPHTFINLVASELKNTNPNKPVVLVGTLLISHWPYVWARQPNLASLPERYEDTVMQLDKQFSELLDIFKKRGLMNNSIVVVLSDHGDSLGIPGDRIITTQNYIGPPERRNLITRYPYINHSDKNKLLGIDTSAGHGTDLLSMTQLHTTLAIYHNRLSPRTIYERVALIDVAPTILDLLKIKKPSDYEGISLLTVMTGETGNVQFNRPLFLESEIDIPLIDVTKQHENKSSLRTLINQYAKLFDIDLNTQYLVLKDDAITPLLKEKQRGIMAGDWLFVYYPGFNQLQTDLIPPYIQQMQKCYYYIPAIKEDNKVSEYFCYYLSPVQRYYVLINLITKKWQIIFPNEIPANPVANTLFQKLKSFYGDEIPD